MHKNTKMHYEYLFTSEIYHIMKHFYPEAVVLFEYMSMYINTIKLVPTCYWPLAFLKIC